MVFRKDKNDKLAVRPSERKGELTTRRPFDIWDDMDRLFDRFRADFDDLFWPYGENSILSKYTNCRTPAADVADLGDKYEMNLEIPGITKDNIDIEVTPNGVEISAKYEDTQEEKSKNWLRRECSGMSFYRSFELPEELKTDDVEAEMNNGILTLILPKVEPKPRYKAKKIEIK